MWDAESNDPNPLQLISQWQAINTTTWKATDTLTIKNIASYSEYREDANFSLWGDNFIFPPGFPGAGQVFVKTLTLQQGRKGHTTAQSTFSDELQFQGRALDGRLNWQAGAYLEISKPLGYSTGAASSFLSCSNVATQQCINPLGFGTISTYSIKDTYNNKGLYAQANY